jgi:CBS domain-containing protein
MTMVSEVMTTNVKIAAPDQTLQQVAGMMADLDAGVIPVHEKDRLIGMVTDRDIAVRAVAQGLPPDTQVRQIMTKEIKYCFDDDNVDEVARNMADIKVRRLPVINRDKRLVGIFSLGDMAVADGPDNAGVALCGISEPGGEHSQAEDGKH